MDRHSQECGEKTWQLEQKIEFERCIEFLVRMIEKYGDVVLKDLEESGEKVSK